MADDTTTNNGGGSSNGEGERWSLLPQLQPLAPILSRQTSGATYASLGVASPAPSDGASSIASPCLRRKRPRQLQGNAALTINVLTALWGPAVFAMPWAFQEAGLAAGAIGVVVVAVFSFTTLTLLIRTKRLFSDGPCPSDAAAAAAATAVAGVEGGDATPPTPFMYGAVVSPIVMGEGIGENGLPEDGDGDEEKQRTQAALLRQARRQQALMRQQQAGRGEELTYAQVAARALGRHASRLVKGATTISCLGACAAYLSFIVGMIVQLAPQWGEERVLLAFFPLLVLLSWVRGFRRLSFLNVLGNLSLLGGVLAIFYDGFAHGHHRKHSFSEIVAAGSGGAKAEGEAIRWVNPSTLLLFFGPTAFLFVIHYCAVPIESEAADPKEFAPVLARSMALTAILDIVVGCAGYSFYGREPLVRDPSGRVLPGCERNVCDNVLKNVEAGPVKSAIIVVFSINLVLAFEVMLIPPREYVERWLIKPSRPYYRLLPTKWQRNLTRTLLVLVTFAVAFSMKNFGLLTGFVGAITDTLQGFVLPPLMYAAAHKATIAPPKRAALLAMSVLGVLLMLSATYQNAGELQRLLVRRAEASRLV